MFYQNKKLILVSADKQEWTPTGKTEKVAKMKYTFLDEKGDLMMAYENLPGTYIKDVKNTEQWDEGLAENYKFAVLLFKGGKQYKLVPKGAKV